MGYREYNTAGGVSYFYLANKFGWGNNYYGHDDSIQFDVTVNYNMPSYNDCDYNYDDYYDEYYDDYDDNYYEEEEKPAKKKKKKKHKKKKHKNKQKHLKNMITIIDK